VTEPAQTLALHRSLYRADAVEAAAAAYAQVATIAIAEEASELLVTFAGVDPDVEGVLLDAFANHALFETIRRHRSDPGQQGRDAVTQVG
jgi:hypothetical protein